MRLRVMPLGEVALGSALKTTFVIVVDRIGDFAWSEEASDGIKKATGAEGVLVFEDTEIELDTTAVTIDEDLVQSVSNDPT